MLQFGLVALYYLRLCSQLHSPFFKDHRASLFSKRAMDHRRKAREPCDDEINLQPPSKRVSRSRSPKTSASPNSIAVEGISDRVLEEATSGVQLEAAMQELEEDSLTVTLSREMEVLYDPLEASESRTRVTPQNEVTTEYDLSSLLSPRYMDAQIL